jgi:hypothetical protein
MKHEVICGWLGLKPEDWPPNHYTLLGLEPGDEDTARIEQRVHERMARLRCYQVCNPEQATEAMNRLAQAFLCLTDPKTKKNYDAGLLSVMGSMTHTVTPPAAKKKTAVPGPAAASPAHRSSTEVVPQRLPAALLDTAVNGAPVTQVVWKVTVAPPPVRALVQPGEAVSSGPPKAREAPVSEAVLVSPPPASPAVEQSRTEEAAPATPPIPEMRAEGSASGSLAKYKGFSPGILRLLSCRRGLGTKRALYQRIRKTRRLLWAWDRAGKYLRKPKRMLKNAAEEKNLGRALAAIGEHLRGFPRFLGRPGQPGYRIAARARLAFAVDWVNGLNAEERELLAQDWAAGQTLLSSHRQFLRKEARAVRDLPRWRLAFRVLACDFSLELALLGAFLVVILTIFALAVRY